MPSTAAEKIRMKYSSAKWIPFSYIDESGTPQGLYIDLLHEIFTKQLGIEIEYQQLPWKRAQYSVEFGKADFLITIKSEKRLQYATPSELPLLRLYLNVFTYKNHEKFAEIEKISSGEDIKTLNIIPVTNIGNGWHKTNIDSYGVATHYVSDEESAFKVVASKRADITIEPIHAGTYLIKKLGLQDKIQVSDAKFGPLDFYLLFSKKSPYHSLMPQINDVIERLTKNGTLEKISHKYKTLK